jgi:hypothetical protein
MREKLIRYVDLLFAGIPDATEIRQEILQNTLDRYDDLIDQGKSPEAAYSLSIAGIGDISELLHQNNPQTPPSAAGVTPTEHNEIQRKKTRAFAIFLYILCPIPLFILNEFGYDVMGLCMTLLLVAAATYLIIISGKGKSETPDPDDDESDSISTPDQKFRDSIGSVIWAIGLGIYLILSFITDGWFITWVIFPLIGCVQGLVNAILDLKGAK